MSKLSVQGRYGVIPHSVLYSNELSLKAKGLYGYMQSKPDGWEFSAERISLECRDGRSSIETALQELEDAGFLQRRTYKNEKGQWEWEHVLVENPVSENLVSENPVSENRASNKEVISKKDTVRSNTLRGEGFDDFWNEYPRRIAKVDAQRAWSKLEPHLKDDIIKGLRAWKDTEQWKREGGRFIPHPATFLNQRRWEDDITTEVTSYGIY